MKKLEYTFKNDALFKMLFVKHPGLLKQLVSELLNIPLNSIERFEITNPEMPPEAMGRKFCRLDINMIVNCKRVNLEIQVKDRGDFPERVMFHWAKMYSSELKKSGRYIDLPHTVIISIINFNRFDCTEFHSEFRPLETTRRELMSEKMCFHFFELKKVPRDITADNMLLLWLSLFKAETQEEIDKIKSMEVPVMEEAINAYNEIAVSPELRELERLLFLASVNEASALHHARVEEQKKLQGVIAAKDAALADKDAALADKDTTLANKDAEIERLRALLEKSKL